jgi:hypothetical protein
LYYGVTYFCLLQSVQKKWSDIHDFVFLATTDSEWTSSSPPWS